MKKYFLSSTAAMLLATNAFAGGFSFEGANVEATSYFYNGNGNEWQNYQIEGSVHVNFGNYVGAQVDLGTAWYDGDEAFDHMTYGLHLFYNVNDAVKVGAFAGRLAWDGGTGWEDYYGAEGRYDNGPISVQAFAGIVAYYSNPNRDNKVYGILAEYNIGAVGSLADVSLSARTNVFDFAGTTNDFVSYALGSALHFENGAYVELEVGQTGFLEGIMYPRISVAFGWDFGNSTPFERRDYYQVWQGY
ncbi:MAG: hypothetical protein COB08_019140 [Rhodobacteraceae bacterium]|nr:hypothetical protein [Paracoccaceae bacterium]